MSTPVDVLIPTCRRPAALAVTLAGIAAQGHGRLRVVVSDQTPDGDPLEAGEVRAVLGILRARGVAVETHRHLPHRGMAEHRQFLLDRAEAPAALFLDDDVWIEPDLIARMLGVLQAERCGFVGCAVIGPSFLDDVRPHQQEITFWDGPVRPEAIHPGTRGWDRYRLHNAANLYHLQRRLGLTAATQRTYKVAWVGGCVLYDVARLRAVGGFEFWRDLPVEHCGEDVLAQQRLMARSGGCGLIPSGAYHLELPTTIPDRRIDAPQVLRGGTPLRPRVSVVMPVGARDASPFGALECLRAQTLVDWELLLMDRGMSEPTRAGLAPFLADPRVRYYRLDRDPSLQAALDQAQERAQAPTIAYLLPGDTLAPDFLLNLAGSRQ